MSTEDPIPEPQPEPEPPQPEVYTGPNAASAAELALADRPRIPRYYEDLGRAHDYLLRCKDCKALVPFAVITAISCCDKCGNKRFIEITLLQEQEMADIVSGKIDFPDRDLFLKEFAPVEPIARA